MELLIESKEIIKDIKSKVDKLDNSFFTHVIINNYDITNDCISIVMTSSNRSKQTYFTLQSMLKSKCKNIHIILVDDSDEDQINLNILKNFPYYIDFISIKRINKNWVNPAVNYNIGFKYIKGNKIVIQNAEVCHVRDPLDFINNSLESKHYYVFDVAASLNYEANEEIYKSDLTDINIYNKNLFSMWYQHHKARNCLFHFFTALDRKTFDKIKEFSYDYSMGHSYDDNDFLLKILVNNIQIKNVCVEEKLIGGIHLYHILAGDSHCKDKVSNESVFIYKKKYVEEHDEYIEIFET